MSSAATTLRIRRSSDFLYIIASHFLRRYASSRHYASHAAAFSSSFRYISRFDALLRQFSFSAEGHFHFIFFSSLFRHFPRDWEISIISGLIYRGSTCISAGYFLFFFSFYHAALQDTKISPLLPVISLQFLSFSSSEEILPWEWVTAILTFRLTAFYSQLSLSTLLHDIPLLQ